MFEKFTHKNYSTHMINPYRFKLVTVVVPNELSPHACTQSFIWVVKFKYCSMTPGGFGIVSTLLLRSRSSATSRYSEGYVLGYYYIEEILYNL